MKAVQDFFDPTLPPPRGRIRIYITLYYAIGERRSDIAQYINRHFLNVLPSVQMNLILVWKGAERLHPFKFRIRYFEISAFTFRFSIFGPFSEYRRSFCLL